MVALPLPLKNQPVMVLGAGVSGMAASRLLLHIGAQVSIVEDNPEVAQAAQHLDVPVYTMAEAIDHLSDTSLVVTSPGLPLHITHFLLKLLKLTFRYGVMSSYVGMLIKPVCVDPHASG